MNAGASNWKLAKGEGVRKCLLPIAFERRFAAPPVVHVGLSGVDASKDHNLRLSIRATDITALGFTVEVETWLHSEIFAVDVSWLAIGS
jgi:hypothetical protein